MKRLAVLLAYIIHLLKVTNKYILLKLYNHYKKIDYTFDFFTSHSQADFIASSNDFFASHFNLF